MLRRLLRDLQMLQHLHRQHEVPALPSRAARHARDQARQIGRHDRAQQHDHPGDVDPEQQNRQRRKGAVQHRIGGHRGDIDAKHLLGQLDADRDKDATGPRIAPWHLHVGNVAIQPRHAAREQDEFDRIKDETRTVRQGLAQPPGRRRRHPGGERQADRQHQRTERDRGPIDQHALAQWPQLAHAPDVVERAVDRENQHQGRDHQDRQTHRAQATRLGRELREVVQHRPRNGVRDQAVHQPALQQQLHFSEDRKCGKNRQRHGHEGHQCQ